VTERLAGALGGARHAAALVLEEVVSVAPGWLVAGLLLHVLHQVIRTRGWFNIIRAAYPHAIDLRARDVTFAYLAGAGLNSVVPARGADLAKLYLIRKRAPDTRWSTLAATLVPETLFETAVGLALVIWTLCQGFLPVPAVPNEVPVVDVSLVIQHPFVSTGIAAACGLASVTLFRVLRMRTRRLVARLGQGMAILHRPHAFVCGVVIWQALGRIIRLGSLACFMAAFGLPVTLATAVLVMAAQAGGRIVPIAPASASLRVAMLTYGFPGVTNEAVDIARITAFSFGVAATLSVIGIVIAITILGRDLGTASPRRIVAGLRERLGEPAAAPQRAPVG
jgi:hypothetical protein